MAFVVKLTSKHNSDIEPEVMKTLLEGYFENNKVFITSGSISELCLLVNLTTNATVDRIKIGGYFEAIFLFCERCDGSVLLELEVSSIPQGSESRALGRSLIPPSVYPGILSPHFT